MRKLIAQDPFPPGSSDLPPWGSGFWPAQWLGHPGVERGPAVLLFRLELELPEARTVRAHVSADERYILSLNGAEEGRGPERGNLDNWFFESYDLELQAGRNLILAKVWATPANLRPFAQISLRPAFLLASEGDGPELSTGQAAWRVAALDGHEFVKAPLCWGRASDLVLDGNRRDWEREAGRGEGWGEPEPLGQAASAAHVVAHGATWKLTPATLPPMLLRRWDKGAIRRVSPESLRPWEDNAPLIIPPRGSVEILLDLQDYVCAYNALTASGGKGASVSLAWAEALFDADGQKGDRNEVEGRSFVGEGDCFLLDGGTSRRYESLWWHAGRYLRVRVDCADEAAVLERLDVLETRYPLELTARFACSDPFLEAIVPPMSRALQMCAHETFMDCPYYEQQMYVGDTRLEMLAVYATCGDDRLPRKAIRMFDSARDQFGRIPSQHPSKARQFIPGFTLLWVGMLHDFALWRGDRDFVAAALPGMRQSLDFFLGLRRRGGVVETPVGWNFMDWVNAWTYGVPPSSSDGLCGPLNWLLVYALNLAAELESWVGEPELEARWRRHARELAAAARQCFWDAERGLFADNSAKTSFSEHSQCLAILGGQFPPELEERLFATMLAGKGLARCSIYFSHYLFETAYKLRRPEIIMERLREDWGTLLKMGFKTTYESPLPTRSDCHAWGAHPLYHYHATLLGVRPAAFGFAAAAVSPLPGELTFLEGEMPHPRGTVRARCEKTADGLRLDVSLPSGVTQTCGALPR